MTTTSIVCSGGLTANAHTTAGARLRTAPAAA